MKATKTLTRRLSRLAAVVLVLCMVFGLMAINGSAVNSAVQNAARGVLQINVYYRDDYNNEIPVQTGSCFLINEQTVVTCAHCITVSDEWLEVIAEYAGKSTKETFNRLGYSITISRDVTIKATVKKQSQEVDFAILDLETSLKDRTPLVMRHSSEVEQTETVYAIGFPAQPTELQAINLYTPEDATITDGRVNKLITGANIFSGATTDYITNSCKITSGNSGGPLLDEDGAVIGICQSGTGDQTVDYYHAISIDQVLTVCDSLGIPYTLKNFPTPTPSSEPTTSEEPTPTDDTVRDDDLRAAISAAERLNKDDYSASSYAALEDALVTARAALNSNSQAEIDAATQKLNNAKSSLVEAKGSNKTLLLIIIAAVALVLIAIIVIIIVLSNSKKKQAAQPAQRRPQQPPVQPDYRRPVPPTAAPQNNAFASQPVQPAPQQPRTGTMPLSGEAGATTVLTQSAGETTVLSQKVNGGKLIRRKNGEQVEINAPEFVIGRERRQVNYCIADNSSVGRAHAKLVVKNGTTYLVDLRSTNGTFINGIKATPNQEMPLKNGDKVTLADDEFEFRA